MSRETDIVVHLIDRDKARDLIIKKRGFEADAPIHAEYMVVVNGEKGLATVITEGVGWYADKDGGIPINYWTGQYGGGGYVDITEDELRTIISDETVNLAEHIRTFGDRLETNFYIWRQYALGYPQDKMSLVNATMVA